MKFYFETVCSYKIHPSGAHDENKMTPTTATDDDDRDGRAPARTRRPTHDEDDDDDDYDAFDDDVGSSDDDDDDDDDDSCARKPRTGGRGARKPNDDVGGANLERRDDDARGATGVSDGSKKLAKKRAHGWCRRQSAERADVRLSGTEG